MTETTSKPAGAKLIRLEAPVVSAILSLSSKNQQLTEELRQVKEEKETYKRESRTDALTGVGNRREADEILLKEFKSLVTERKSLTVILADVDGMKEHNDQDKRHAKGDWVIKTVATVLRQSAEEVSSTEERRDKDNVGDMDHVGRTFRRGGDEFLITLPGTTKENAKSIIPRINERLSKENIFVSVGIATITGLIDAEDEADMENQITALIDRADKRLYKMKQDKKDAGAQIRL